MGIRVLIADDHRLIREGLKKVLGDVPDMEVVADAGTASGVLEALAHQPVDVAILGITLSGRSGLDLLKDLNQFYPHVPVLMLNIHEEERYMVLSLRAGASGYLTKDSTVEELADAIRKLAQGRKYIAPSLAEHLAAALDPRKAEIPHRQLSNREYQILLMIASGKRVRDIARELSLSVSTVNTYRSRILEKMRMRHNADLIRYAITHRLVE
jgi:DNA-binding NarL/FixJ family response regulator